MGMYTELVVAFELRPSTPPEVLDLFRFLCGLPEDDATTDTPDHPFFNCPRWRYIASMDSAYFPGETHSEVVKKYGRAWFVTIRSNLKNYDGEIEKFLDWVAPYIEPRGPGSGAQFIGYSRYEECEHPTLIYVTTDGRVELSTDKPQQNLSLEHKP